MKFIFFIFSFLIFQNLLSQNNWIKQQSSVQENLKKIFFCDSLYGWIIGDSGVILHTNDGGNNWISQSRNSGHFLVDVFFLNRNIGWAIGWKTSPVNYGTVIYKTSNSGNNWSFENFYDTTLFVSAIYFLSQTKGVIGCEAGIKTLYYTSNGGNNWIASANDSTFYSNFPVREIKFKDENTGFAVGGYFDMAGVVWKTTNGGMYWSDKVIGSEPINDICFLNNNKLITAGGDFEYGVSIGVSENFGSIWNYIMTGCFGIGYSISFRNNLEGWIPTGFSQKFLFTSNSGINWNITDTPDSSSIYWTTFSNQKTGWSVGSNGTILKYLSTNVGISFDDESLIKNDIEIKSVYPNPFNSSTNIQFEIKTNGNIQIAVFDINGKEVYSSNRINYDKGKHSFLLKFPDLSSGIYFYELQYFNGKNNYAKLKTGKLLLIK